MNEQMPSGRERGNNALQRIDPRSQANFVPRLSADGISSRLRGQGAVEAPTQPSPRFRPWQNLPFTRRFQIAYAILLLIALAGVPIGVLLAHKLQAQRYVLSAAAKQLVGQPAPSIDSKLTYNKQKQVFQYSPSDSQTTQTGSDSSDQLGGSQYYGVNLAAAADKGQTFTDTTTKLSFSIAPDFGALKGKHIDGHVVYPFSKGQIVYTLKDNGLREDVVLTKPVSGTTLQYKLKLPDTLEARVEPTGSLGIYSADPTLFGTNPTDDATRQALQKAQAKGAKNNLVFMLPAPVVNASQGSSVAAQAHFSLKGDVLSVVADNLKQLHYPISIDPSVVIQAANLLSQGNNEDNDVTTGASSVTRNAVSGGVVNTIAADTSCSTTTTWCAVQTGTNGYNGSGIGGGGAWGAATLAYNGYLYAVGGAYNNNSSYINTVSYAAISASNGSIGAWTVGSTLAGGTGGLSEVSAAIYNGYIYVVGGAVGGGAGSTVAPQYALICTGNNAGQGGCSSTAGSVGTWTLSTNSTNFYSVDSQVNRAEAGMVAYQGYMYIFGGFNATTNGFVSDTLYAPILANGDLGNWATTASMPNGGSSDAVAYNGHVYVGLTCIATQGALQSGCSAATNILVGTIAPTGGISTWSTTGVTTPTYSVLGPTLGVPRPAMTVANGYLYIMGGGANNTSTSAVVSYAPLLSNGSVGAAVTTTPLISSNGRTDISAAFYNGYLYTVGGIYNVNTADSSTYYAKIDAAASDSRVPGYGGLPTPTTWTTSSTHYTTKRGSPGVVTSNGYIYILGGSVSGGTVQSVEYALICTGSNTTLGCTTSSPPGSVGTFNFTKDSGGTEIDLGAVIPGASYISNNGYLYTVGGQLNDAGDTYSNEVKYAAVCTGSNTTTGFTTNCGASSPPGSTSSWAYTANSTMNNTTQTGGFDNAGAVGGGRSHVVVAAYNGYMYIAGGCRGAQGSSHFCGVYDNTVESAVINANGTIGAWPGTTAGIGSFATARTNLSGTIYNGYLYIVGGCSVINNTGLCGTVQSDFQYVQVSNGALVSSNGCTPTTWCSGTFQSGGFMWTVNALTASNGYLYLAEGTIGGSNNVLYASVLANGSLGTGSSAWNMATAVYGTARENALITSYNGTLYVAAGCTNATLNCNFDNGYTTDMQYVAPQIPAHVAHYTYLVDLKSTSNSSGGGDPQVTKFGVGLTKGDTTSTVSACWQSATSAAPSGNNTFGTSTCQSGASSIANLVSLTNGYGRYGFVTVTLDDSQAAIYPDSAKSSFGGIAPYFHASPARRLRGGQTFTDTGVQNGLQSQLDTN